MDVFWPKLLCQFRLTAMADSNIPMNKTILISTDTDILSEICTTKL